VSNVPADLLYTNDHEFVRKTDDPNTVVVGITDYAQGELGDVVFVNLPKVGDKFGAHAVFGTIEAVKAVSELYSPVAGEVIDINGGLEADPASINRDPYGDGYLVKIKMADASGLAALLSAEAYKKHIGE